MNDEETRSVRIGRDPDASIKIGEPVLDAHDCAQIPIEIVGGGIRAYGAALLVLGGPTVLLAYFDDLAANWRGWSGIKDWQDDEGQVSMSATHDGKGQVLLSVEVRNMAYRGPGHWRAAAVVLVEPGALDRVAAEVRSVLIK